MGDKCESERVEKGMEMNNDDKCVLNTDREIWRERPDDYYADSIHVTEGGGIGLNCGGHVIVKPIREWFKLASPPSVSVNREPDLRCPHCNSIARKVEWCHGYRMPHICPTDHIDHQRPDLYCSLCGGLLIDVYVGEDEDHEPILKCRHEVKHSSALRWMRTDAQGNPAETGQYVTAKPSVNLTMLEALKAIVELRGANATSITWRAVYDQCEAAISQAESPEKCPTCGSRKRDAFGQINYGSDGERRDHGAGVWPSNCRDSWHAESEPAGQGEWIAVSERLPKAKLDDIYSEGVLVMFAGRRTVARRDTSSNEWQETSAYHCVTLDEQAVTFWRKLPSPPASEATKDTK